MTNLDINVEFGKCSFEIEAEKLQDSEEKDESESPLELETIQSGSLYLDEHRADTKHIPFLLTPYSVDMEDLLKIVFEGWKLPHPRIILFAIAETEDSPSDEYRKMSRKLVKGLVQSLNTTEMWLCTDGLNHGFSSDIGKAFENETSRRKTMESSMQSINSASAETVLIGICRRDVLKFSDKFGEKKTLEERDSEIKLDINRRYGYFIFIEDTSETRKGVVHFLLNFAHYMSKYEERKSKYDDSSTSSMNASGTPVIALLLHGKITEIHLVLGHLKQGLPLVIFENSGGLADLLAYAYHQANFRPEGINIAEYSESVLKPQISDRMHKLYPEFSDYNLSHLTETIFDCLRYSKQRDQEFITVLNLNNIEFHPSHLPRYLLKALFKSQTSDAVKGVHEMKKDLFLAMDWNCADVAREEVFVKDTISRFQIDNEMFYRALTTPQREDFVSLFLSQGFVIHTYLDSANLLDLFQNSLNKEFFRAVVWESVLGFGSNVEISRNFLDSTLIILIEEFTGIPSLINSYELDWNCRSIYDDRTPAEAERKAVTVLTLWAILSYRVQLVKTLWRHSEQPIHIALACSMILKKLEAFVTDLSLKNEMDKQSKEFSIMATNVMTLCYESVPCRALDVLNEKNRVWSFKALMEMAAFAKNKMFLAHPCCQKYLDNIFMGYIKIRDLPYGDITIPLWLKIILSAFLIFPMYLWVRFEIPKNKLDQDDSSKKHTTSEGGNSSNKDTLAESSNARKKKSNDPVFFYKIYYLWSAPITKFWVSQVFYLLFLLCFSLAVLWPACGNVFLDFFTCIWIAIIILDSIYHAYTLNTKYTSMPLVYKCLEISIMILFLFGYAMGRIIWKHSFMMPYSAKVMLCIALLYAYYRLIFIALPISSELGPMLYRVKRMTVVDFVSYMRVTILILISNGIVIHATIYPDYPLNWELARRAFYDALISFFLTPAGHYGSPNPTCIRLKRDFNKKSFVGMPTEVCKVGRYLKADCPNPGVWPYLFGLQYLIILRLILFTMLFAIFSNTTRKLEEEGNYIWKYQRYELVINFSNRLTLPPPLCIITFLYMLVKYIYKSLRKCMNRYFRKQFRLKAYYSAGDQFVRDNLDENDFRYWKALAIQHDKQKKQEIVEEITTKKRMERINALADALNKQRRTLRDLEGHLNEVQIQITNAHQYLASSGLQASVRERLHAKDVPQIFSRISPYPNTMVSRFPVSDNHVPWQCTWTMYDPIAFTLPIEDFSSTLLPHVDVDIQRKREMEGEAFRMPHFNWNMISVSPGGVSVDRQSWITDQSNRAFEYELDSEDLPKNPFGRTGLKGRGCLPRWGPNHYIYVTITRWHDKEELIFQRYLEVLLMNTNYDLCLPGGYVHTENRYDIIRSLFQCEEIWKDAEEMIQFFRSLKDPSGRKKSIWETLSKERKADTETDFIFEKVKHGYMDEETNTDQAWCEAEVWHFHYNTGCNINDKIKANLEWHLMSEERLVNVPIGQAAIMHTIAKNMKAILEVI